MNKIKELENIISSHALFIYNNLRDRNGCIEHEIVKHIYMKVMI